MKTGDYKVLSAAECLEGAEAAFSQGHQERAEFWFRYAEIVVQVDRTRTFDAEKDAEIEKLTEQLAAKGTDTELEEQLAVAMVQMSSRVERRLSVARALLAEQDRCIACPSPEWFAEMRELLGGNQ